MPALVALIAVTAVWGVTFVQVKDAVELYPLFAFLAVRFAIAGVVLAVPARSRVRSLGREGTLAGVILGAVALSMINRFLLPDTVGTGGDSHTRFPIGISFPAGSGLVAFAAATGVMPLDMPESVLVRFKGEMLGAVLAAREAMTNAAKFAGVEEIDVYAEVDEDKVHIHADVPPESPTVRGFISLLARTLDGAAPADVARAVRYMADLPLDANVATMTIMATNMPFVGRG